MKVFERLAYFFCCANATLPKREKTMSCWLAFRAFVLSENKYSFISHIDLILIASLMNVANLGHLLTQIFHYGAVSDLRCEKVSQVD